MIIFRLLKCVQCMGRKGQFLVSGDACRGGHTAQATGEREFGGANVSSLDTGTSNVRQGRNTGAPVSTRNGVLFCNGKTPSLPPKVYV